MDQHDDAIDRLLRRGAGQPVTDAVGGCLDGELLAAWSEHTLTARDATRVEHHLADCVRCQEMAALFVRVQDQAPPSSPAHPFRESVMKWLVPLATAAIVVAIWTAVPQRIEERPEEKPVALRESPPPTATPKPAIPAPAGSAATPEPAAPEAERRGIAERQRLTAAYPSAADLPAAAAVPEMRPAASPVTPPAQPTPPPRPASSPQPATSNPLPPRAQTTEAGASTAVATRREVTVAADRAIGLRQVVDILTPDPKLRWRLVDGRELSKTEDGGATWQPLAFTPGAPLFAGDSPIPNVVWLVGQSGTVYLSTDGTTFDLVPFVGGADLISVSAIDGQQATVRATNGRTWRTSDRGKSWVAIP